MSDQSMDRDAGALDRDDAQNDRDASDDAPMYDENAFGLLLDWYDAEDVEYSQSADKFPPRIIVFRSAVAEYLEQTPLGGGVTAIDFGTSVYVEVGDGDQTTDVIGWMKGLRAYLTEGGWTTFGVITHGGRWVARDPAVLLRPSIGTVRVVASFGPSEAMRKALQAQAMSRDDDETGEAGWGPGLFVDADVFEALGKKLKNDPTPLRHAGACYFRISR
jgi:hypothetical protein